MIKDNKNLNDFQQLCSHKNWSLLSTSLGNTLYIKLFVRQNLICSQIYSGNISSSSNYFTGILKEEQISIDDIKQYLKDPSNLQIQLNEKVIKVVRPGVMIKKKKFEMFQIPLEVNQANQKLSQEGLIQNLIIRSQKRDDLSKEEIRQFFEIISLSLASIMKQRELQKNQRIENASEVSKLKIQMANNSAYNKINEKEFNKIIKELQKLSTQKHQLFSGQLQHLREQLNKISKHIIQKSAQLETKLAINTKYFTSILEVRGNTSYANNKINELEQMSYENIKKNSLFQQKFNSYTKQINFKIKNIQKNINFIINNQGQQMQLYSHIYPNGDKYFGGWKNGQRSGRGEIIYANGDKYNGYWKNDKRTGKGQYFWGPRSESKGESYSGEWLNGKQHGKGEYIWANGDKYIGDYQNDERTGKGEYLFEDGEKYTGSFYNGEFEGKGVYFFKNGDKLSGTWRYDLKEGIFVYEPKSGAKQQRLYEKDNLISSKKI